MRSEIKLFEDQYKFFKEMKSKRLLVAFVEFMFEDVEPTDLKGLEKTVFESMRKRMEKSKKIHDGNSKGGSSSHGGGRPGNTNLELERENKSKTSQKQVDGQEKNNEEGSMKKEDIKENIKRKYLDYVYLSDEEYNKISNRYGERVLKDFIERVDNRVGEKPNSKDRTNRDHYRTILNRIKRDGIKEYPPPKKLNEYEISEGVYDLDKLLGKKNDDLPF